jgi:tape measure domain-containing protein
MGSQAQLLARISADATPFTRAIGEVNTALDKAFQRAGASTRGFQALGASLSSFGSTLTLGVTAPVVAFGAAAVQAATKIDSLKRGLTTVTGSAAATEVEFRKLRETAKLPGIDFEQAVRGSIRLQTLGVSADRAREIMGNFANALAAAGGTKADFGEVVRQLSQLSSSAKVTKENLDPIVDRIPAVAAILRDKFGPAALGEPAKVFDALGISGKQLADILSDELGNRVPKITGSAQTAFDSFAESVNEAAGRIGDKLLPTVTATLPKLEALIGSVVDTVDAFSKLPTPVQQAGLAIAGIAVAAGPVLVAAGSLVNAFVAIQGAGISVAGAATAAGAALGAAYLAFEAYKAVGSIADSIKRLGLQFEVLTGQASQAKRDIEFLGKELKTIIPYGGEIAEGLFKLRNELEKYAKIPLSPLNAIAEVLRQAAEITERYTGRTREMNEEIKNKISLNNQNTTSEQEAILRKKELEAQLKRVKEGLEGTAGATGNLSSEVDKSTKLVQLYGNAKVLSNSAEFKTAVLKERLAIITAEYNRKLSDGVASLVKYGSAANAANAALNELRITEEAPTVSNRAVTNVRRLPSPSAPGTPGGAVLDGSDAARSSQRNLDLIRRTAQGAQAAWTQTQRAISRQVSTITTDFSRAVADIITGASSAGEAFKRLGQSIAQSLIRTIVENGVNVAIKALGNLLSSLGGVGKAIGGIFGGGASAAGSAGGSVGGIGGAVGGAAGTGVAGIVTAVSGVVSAISGVIGNFQFAAMNKTLDLIEKEVRFSQIHLLYILEKINQYLPELANIHQRLIEFRQTGIKIEGGGAGTTVNITVQGSLVGGPNVAAELSQMVVRNLKLQGV